MLPDQDLGDTPFPVQRDGVQLLYDAASYFLNVLAIHSSLTTYREEISGVHKVINYKCTDQQLLVV